jgi:hypothetical protein
MGRPAKSTWSTDFLLREDLSREEIGKWFRKKSIPWQQMRRLLQLVTGTFPCGQQLVKYGYKEKTECTLCKKAHEENGSSWTNGYRRFFKSVGARYDGRVVPNLSGPGLCCKSFWVKRAAVRAGLWVTLASTGYYLTADPG